MDSEDVHIPHYRPTVGWLHYIAIVSAEFFRTQWVMVVPSSNRYALAGTFNPVTMAGTVAEW